ncbi:hypothetical protein E4U57_002428 [Claviceps arundinis]|uniref:DUF4097 domain-containing protein n=1 Tax=Claviceps arundinis TaxID=1623583 RepID=A0A9P7N2A7_9HYPO|nr:hypothetical protein E4U57_002428 [Claviceps arundinis]KAG5978578.1 hypothetical protein E4U56_000013 [Claviceps arundinis]
MGDEYNPVEQPIMKHMYGVGKDPCCQCLRPLQYESRVVIPDVIFESGYLLRIEQGLQRNDRQWGREVHVFGRLNICSSEEGTSRGSVVIKIASGDEELTAATSCKNTDEQAITIRTPFAANGWDKNGSRPCIELLITVYVPHGGQIDVLDIMVANLDVSFSGPFTLVATERVFITTDCGRVYAPTKPGTQRINPYGLQSRQIIIRTSSGNVEGWFPLHQVLRIKSLSGSVAIELGLESDSATQANVIVETSSGSINIKTPSVFYAKSNRQHKALKAQPPARDYVVEIASTYGKIEADIVVASRATIRSKAGDLLLRLLPVPFSSKGNGKTYLVTELDSGDTKISLMDPSQKIDSCAESASWTMGWKARRTDCSGLAGLHSTHRSAYGGIKVDYPESWTGDFNAESVCGKIAVRGVNITIVRSSTEKPRVIGGQMGSGGSAILMKSSYGDIEFYADRPWQDPGASTTKIPEGRD